MATMGMIGTPNQVYVARSGTSYTADSGGKITATVGPDVLDLTTAGCIAEPGTNGVGFFGATPITSKPASASQAATTVTAVTSIVTTALTGTSPKGFTTKTQGNNLVARMNQAIVDIGALATQLNRMRTDMVNYGLIKGSS